MTELERCKEVLTSVLAYIGGYGESEKLVNEIRDILYPAPIMEPVEEIVGWVNVYQDTDGHPYISLTYNTEEDANEGADHDRISCQPIKVTVQREKRMPVERSVTVEANVTEMGDVCSTGESTLPFRKYPEFYGCKGRLTFTTDEEPHAAT